MKVTYIEASYSVTVSYAKFRFVKIGYTAGATLDENDSPEIGMDALRESLRKKVAKDAKAEVAHWRKIGAQVESNQPAIDLT